MPSSALSLDIDAYRVIPEDDTQENALPEPSYRFISEEVVEEDEAGWSVISKRGLASAYADDEPDYST